MQRAFHKNLTHCLTPLPLVEQIRQPATGIDLKTNSGRDGLKFHETLIAQIHHDCAILPGGDATGRL